MSGRARAGHREPKQIAAAIRAALDGAALSLTGLALIDLASTTPITPRQPDGETWRGHAAASAPVTEPAIRRTPMTAQSGKDLLVKIGDGGSPKASPPSPACAPPRSPSTRRPWTSPMRTPPDMWRELLAGAGVKSAQISGSGVFKDAASDETIRAAFFNQDTPNWQIAIPGFGTVTGPFKTDGAAIMKAPMTAN